MVPEVGSFVPDNINEPYNTLIMLNVLHDAFRAFHFLVGPIWEVLPQPGLLGIHTTNAKILHVSGMSRLIESYGTDA